MKSLVNTWSTEINEVNMISKYRFENKDINLFEKNITQHLVFHGATPPQGVHQGGAALLALTLKEHECD